MSSQLNEDRPRSTSLPALLAVLGLSIISFAYVVINSPVVDLSSVSDIPREVISYIPAPSSQLAQLSGANSGLVGWWKLDETSGTTATDASLSNNTATLVSSPTWTSGKFNNSLLLNGSSQYMTANTVAAAIASGSFTIATWIKLAAPFSGTSPADQAILKLGDSPSNNDVNLCWNGTDVDNFTCPGSTAGSICFSTYGSNFTSICSAQNSWTAATWYHVVATMDTASAGMKLYVNGTEVAANASKVRGSTPATHLYLGASFNNVIKNFLSGNLDDVRIYNKALTAGEVTTLYQLDVAAGDTGGQVGGGTQTTYNIIASTDAGGTISPSGSVSVNSGASQTFNVTPGSGYKINSVTVDGATVSLANGSYTFSNVTAGHSIIASFVTTIVDPPPAGAATYYVDFDGGNDGNSGLSTGAAWKHAPGDGNSTGVSKAYRMKPGDVLQFKAGVVYRGTVILYDQSGTESQPVTLKGTGWGSGKAIISGAEPVTSSWVKCDSSCGPNWQNIYYASVPSTFRLNTTDFFQGDDMLYVAQDPNITDPFWSDRINEFRTVKMGDITLSTIKDPNFFTQTNPNFWNGAYMLIWVNGNVVVYRKVTGFSPSTNTISFETLSAESLYTDRDQVYSIINSLGVLDKPGEYVLDEVNNRLYLWPKTFPINVDGGVRNLGIRTSGTANLVIDGFIVEKQTGYSGAYAMSDVCCGQVSNLMIKNNEVRFNRLRDFGTQGTIYFRYMTNITLQDNIIHDNRMTAYLGGGNVKLLNNTIYRNGYKGFWLMGNSTTPTRSLIIGNKFYENTGTHGTDISIFGSYNVLVANNIFTNTGQEVISFYDTGPNFIIHNNVMIGAHRDGGVIRLNGTAVGGNLIITNNVAEGSDPNDVSLYVAASSNPAARYFIRNNIFDSKRNYTLDNSKYGFSNNILDGATWLSAPADWYNNLGPGEFIQTDLTKIFASTASPLSGGYKLGPGSVAIDKGVNILPLLPAGTTAIFPEYDFSKDIIGTPRPQGATWDIGPYEYYSGQIVTPTDTGGNTPTNFNPADTTQDWRVTLPEIQAYALCWKTSGCIWSVGPNPILQTYLNIAAHIYRTGEVYHYDGNKNCPSCYVKGQ